MNKKIRVSKALLMRLVTEACIRSALDDDGPTEPATPAKTKKRVDGHIRRKKTIARINGAEVVGPFSWVNYWVN